MAEKQNKKQQKNQNDTAASVFKELKDKMQSFNTIHTKIPSILEFVDDKKYLGLPYSNPPIKLFPMQRLILKCFYRGSAGNEDAKLTEEDKILIEKNNLNVTENGGLIDKWDTGHCFRELVLVWGRRCLSESMQIVDIKTGKLWTLGELWNFGAEKIETLTYDEKSKTMIVMNDCNIIHQGKKEVFQIQTSSGHEIEATDNHPLLTENGWVEVKDLKPKDKIAICSYQPFFGNSTELSKTDAELLGYLSSSCFDSVGSYLATTLKDGEVLEEFKSTIKTINSEIKIESAENYNIKTIDERKYNFVATQKASNLKNTTATNIVNLLQSNGIKNKTGMQKFVPARIFTSPKIIIAAYLKSLFSCDGIITISNSTRYSAKIEAYFSSSHVTKQIQHLLSRFGIFSTFQSKITDGKVENILCIQKNSHVKRFIRSIGMSGQKELVQSINENISDDNDITDIIFSPITYIRKSGEKQTFDIQVSDKPNLQNFVANNIVCHNSGKDFLCSIIALYEAMRLLECPGGNPYVLYNLGMADPFTILTIANSSSQAKILFRQIKEKVLSSTYFRDKIVPEGVSSDAIYFLTPEDKKRNKELIENGFAPGPGSIVVKAGHSNSDTLVGISCFVLLLDEIGLYKNTAGSSSGDAIYNSLAPAVKTYIREIPKLDKNGVQILDSDGKPEKDKVYDGKIICLSTPRGKEGIFYELYEKHAEVPHRLVCRAATWQVHPMQSKERLLSEFPNYPAEKFDMEFGAEFSGTAGENFFSQENVEGCFRNKNLQFRNYGVPGPVYFAHLDPATSSHNYALVISHRELFFNEEERKRDWRIIVDHINFWSPSPGSPISVEDVDEYVIDISRKFHLGIVTYDHFNSQSSIAKLRKYGIPTKMTTFTKQYKNLIYSNLYQIVVDKRLFIPNHLLLKNEMLNLQRKWLDTGFKVYPKRDGDVTTDDIADALAGSVYNCIEPDQYKLPLCKTVLTPNSRSGIGGPVWQSMQGIPYGREDLKRINSIKYGGNRPNF